MTFKIKEKTFITHSPDETRHIGEILGNLLKAGMRLGLQGDLGSGKTAFIQGMARGLGVPTDYYVTSPTYNIINEYPGRHVLFHMDLYRMGQISMIEDLCELEDIGLSEILDSKGVVAIEWADMLVETLITQDFSIQLDIVDDATRKIRLIAYGPEAVNLLENLDSKATQQPGENK
jgi:tRNA threonylcarbamoyladenosine biosynthesis protein TsaE